jgi:hypothetical protein
MTARRPQRKLSALCFGLGAALAASALLAAIPMRAATTERIVVDWHTGLAISGYDPVAYFIEQRAVPGKGDIEYAFAGGVWRFRNEGNRGAFAADPAVYMPQFGGYDPLGIVRGVTVPGNPRLWHIVGDRLFLFYSLDAQALFVLDAERIIAIGGRKWPSLQYNLTP